MSFSELRRRYERKENTSDLCREEGAIRFLKIRSLKKEQLSVLSENLGINTDGQDEWSLRENLFNSVLTDNQITDSIEEAYPSERENRLENEAGLKESLKEVTSISCGARDDDPSTLIKQIVRDKSIKTLEELNTRIEKKIEQIRNYVKWSWYNQNTNDIIEHFINDHSKILPTLRKVHGIDFFLKSGNIPLDFKLSYIPQVFFDLIRLQDQDDLNDFSNNLSEEDKTALNEFVMRLNFSTERKKTELEIIRKLISQYKRRLGYNNFANDVGGKIDTLVEYINNKFPADLKTIAEAKFTELIEFRKQVVEFLKEHPKILATWLYADQGERLFNNNNRFLVILVDSTSLIRPDHLKSEFDLIQNHINAVLNNIEENSLYGITYQYDKDERHRGTYTTTAFLTIIEKPEINP